MEIKRVGTRPSAKGPGDWFTGTVRIDPLIEVPEPARVAGVVVNRYPAENAGVAEETNPRVIARWGRTPVLCVVPDEPMTGVLPSLPAGVVAAIEPVDWQQFATQG